MGQLLNDSLLIFGFLAIVLAPLTLVLDTGPGGAGWKLLTFLCCTLTAWVFFWLKISSSLIRMAIAHAHARAHATSAIDAVRDPQRIAANIAKLPELLRK